ncbi:putative mannosyltransferase [Rhodotorula diobovata]|uniref:Putative mannosyltransferase n=1 Tax=Rhodotorula diobovata TaxID=5288 RepID=A0A5C5G4H1_9BASI|nr:putative mannosyltransferase [Rhodotorula diobovata]
MSSRLAGSRVPPLRFLAPLVAVVVLVAVHLVAVHQSDSYARHASVQSLKLTLGLGSDGMIPLAHDAAPSSPTRHSWDTDTDTSLNSSSRANAAFVILARNSDVWEILDSIRGIEDRFNRRYHYPYVFLNDQPFSDEFKRHTSGIASGPCSYGLVPKEHWEEPDWIDEDKAAVERQKMADNKVIYGDSRTYRRMCRYQSGWFFRHPLLAQYDYYWRIEPSVKFFCDIDYDPFVYMRDHGKKYGWTISLYEYEATIPTLWDVTKEFTAAHPEYLASPNSLSWISSDNGTTYNRCHFWSNFEIGALDFLRSEAYVEYFAHLDRSGGFSYERWGDAPVHSIAAALFLKPEEVHWFHDIGYRHPPFQHCPKDSASRCGCNPQDSNNFGTDAERSLQGDSGRCGAL